MLPRLIAAVLALALPACSLLRPQFEQPTVTVVGIELRSGNLLQQTFAVKLHVQNPNTQALPVRDLHFSVRVDGEAVADGVNQRAFVVPASGEMDFDMNISANLAVVILKLAGKRQAHADSLSYEVTGSASVELPFWRAIAFHQSGSLPLTDFYKQLN
jgi:LEA14-like dessication related protein